MLGAGWNSWCGGILCWSLVVATTAAAIEVPPVYRVDGNPVAVQVLINLVHLADRCRCGAVEEASGLIEVGVGQLGGTVSVEVV